jgi:hypothetical protein
MINEFHLDEINLQNLKNIIAMSAQNIQHHMWAQSAMKENFCIAKQLQVFNHICFVTGRGDGQIEAGFTPNLKHMYSSLSSLPVVNITVFLRYGIG